MTQARKTPKRPAKTAAQRMADYRARMRARGLKPIQVWSYDVKDPKFIAQCKYEAETLAKHYRETGDPDQAFIDALVGDWDDL
jgi:hypothetical protein